jgi:hypothetical protein
MKYGNKRVEVDGIKFDSKKESKRYSQLKLLERANEIKELKMQVPFELQPSFKLNKKTIRAIKYIADFTYIGKDGKLVVEDTKGYRTDVYKLKKKLFEYKYGIEITEL